MVKRREACSDCVTHCNSTRQKVSTPKRSYCFFKVMIGDFQERLRIPPAFVKHIEAEDSKNVILEGPSENLWKLALERTTTGMFLQGGWGKFVKDHSIQVGEFLVFQYNGDLHFTVKIFSASACEKEDSFHAKNGEGPIIDENNQEGEELNVELTQKKNGKGLSRKRSRVDIVEEPIFSNGSKEQEGVKVGPTRKQNGRDESKNKPVRLPIQINSNSITIKKDLIKQGKKRGTAVLGPSQTLDEKNNRCGTTILDSSGRILICDPKRLNIGPSGSSFASEGKVSSFASKGKVVHIMSKYKSEYFMSLRRPVTNKETARAYEAATSFKSSRPCVRLIMRRSHVYLGFFLQIPAKLVRTHFPPQSQNINLRVPSGGTWCVQYIYNNGKGALSGGWRHFSLENNLECGDVLVLEHVGPDFEYDAHIFRVAANPTCKLLIPGNRKALCSESSESASCRAQVPTYHPAWFQGQGS